MLRGDERHLAGAAQVWAEATAARDGDPDVAPLAVSRPILAGVLARPGAVLVVALDEDENEQVAGFAVAEPVTDGAGPGTRPATAEVRYLGVQPARQGTGLGRGLLRLICAELAAAGFTDAQLLVYADNTPAVRLYEQLGWRPEGTPAPHPRTGRAEQRYRLRLTGGSGSDGSGSDGRQRS
jgi:ribosomal protein S18 acetylase RimI-like enzyme